MHIVDFLEQFSYYSQTHLLNCQHCKKAETENKAHFREAEDKQILCDSNTNGWIIPPPPPSLVGSYFLFVFCHIITLMFRKKLHLDQPPESGPGKYYFFCYK